MQDLAGRFGPEREIAIGRELTKKFEETARMKLGEVAGWLSAEPKRMQGEFVLVVAAGQPNTPQAADADRILEALLEVMAPSEAAKLAARITGLPRRSLYQKALQRSK